jgi:hypothetical protein
VLHVVEEEKGLSVLEVGAEAVDWWLIADIGEAERRRDGQGNEIRISKRSQGNEVDTIWIALARVVHGLHREPRLPGAAGTRECQEGDIRTPQQLPDRGNVPRSADERRSEDRKPRWMRGMQRGDHRLARIG